MDAFFEQAVAAIGRIGQGDEAFKEVGDPLRGVASDPDAVAPEWVRAQLRSLHGSGATSTILGEGPNGLALMQARFPSEAPTLVHDHNSWGVVFVLEGWDWYQAWHRWDDGSDPDRADVRLAEERELGPLDVVWFGAPRQDIHSQQGIGGDVWELVYFGTTRTRRRVTRSTPGTARSATRLRPESARRASHAVAPARTTKFSTPERRRVS